MPILANEQTDWTIQAVRDSISTWMSRDNNVLLQEFGLARDEVYVLNLAAAFTQGLISQADLNGLANTAEGKSHIIKGLYRKRAKGTGTVRTKNGAGGAELADMTPDFQTGIQEGFAITWANYVEAQNSPNDSTGLGEEARARIQADVAFQLREVFRNILERKADQVYAYIVSKATDLTDIPTKTDFDALAKFYTTLNVANEVEIPNTDSVPETATADVLPTWLGRIKLDARNLRYTQFGQLTVLCDTKAMDQVKRYGEKSGNGTIVNLSAQIDGINFVWDPRVVGTGARGNFFLMANNSLGMYDRIFPYTQSPQANENGMIKVGGEMHMPHVTIGGDTGLLRGVIPATRLEYFVKHEIDNTTNIVNNGHRLLDIITRHSFYHQQGLITAIDFDLPLKTPIIKYALA